MNKSAYYRKTQAPEESRYFDKTRYQGAIGFGEKLAKNEDEIKFSVIPDLVKEGCSVMLPSVDKFPFFPAIHEEWPDTAYDASKGARPPDIEVLDPRFNFRFAGTDSMRVFVEFKDFPQMSRYPATGFRIHCARTYIACQHYMRQPVVCLFRDDEPHERGNMDANPPMIPYQSAFKEGGKYLLYGDLLMDMKIHEESCFLRRIDRSKKDFQIRWWSQNRPGPGNIGADNAPIMKPWPEIAELLRSGKVRKKMGDPEGLPIWDFIQEHSEAAGFPKMRVPDGGLVWFTAEEK
jgi:hypothetical protein